MTEEHAELLDIALRAARAGAAILSSHYGAHGDIRQKAEVGELVTDIDIAAEKAVREVITSARPDDLVTGEELPDSSNERASIRWSIDPLDGTTNFTRGIPYFATSIGALDLKTNRWVVGVVEAPLLDQIFFAAAGSGAWLQDLTGVHRLTGPTAQASARLLATGFSYEERMRLEQYAEFGERMAGFTDARALGSAAVAICAVAEGAVDGYIETGLAEYDWAGAAVVAEQAGMNVTRPTADSSLFAAFPQ